MLVGRRHGLPALVPQAKLSLKMTGLLLERASHAVAKDRQSSALLARLGPPCTLQPALVASQNQ